MSVGGGNRSQIGLSGQYGVLGQPSGSNLPPLGQVKEADDGTRRRELVNEELLDEESKAALEADHFVIFGRASVEQYDEDQPSQMLTMEALADALPQLYSDGIISRRHKDIPVGEILATWELEDDAEVKVGDDSLRFDAGETIKTQIVSEGEPRPGGGGTASRDEFWIVADIRNNSEIAKETRLRALSGELDGFSVTIYAKEWEETPKGQRVTEIDWHSVTIGEEHAIKNKDSRFGVAEFKALFGRGSNDAGRAPVEEIRHKAAQTMENQFNTGLFSKAASDLGFDQETAEAAAELASKAEDEDASLEDEAGEIAEKYDVDQDRLVTVTKALSGEGDATSEKADVPDDIEAILDMVEEEVDEEAADALRNQMAAGDGEDKGGYDEEEEEEDGEMKGDTVSQLADEMGVEEEKLHAQLTGDGEETEKSESGESEDVPEGVVTEEKLDERLEDFKGEVATEEDLTQIEESMKAALNDSVEDIVEDTAEKMATGETGSPAGGSTQDSVDYGEAIESNFGQASGD